MPGLDSVQIISDLSATQHTQYTFALETIYGLTIQINQHTTETTVTASLKNDSQGNGNSQDSGALLNQTTESPGYKYKLSPDWGTGFLWYDTAWNGTPEGEYLVGDGDMLQRYGNAWNNAYNTWADQYTNTFSKQECDRGSGKHPFPDTRERRTWVLDGMMLAVWLCLQPDVESVEYSPDAEKVVFRKQGLETTVRLFLTELEKYLT
ncbi:hypothetical protein E0Z10_g7839 [Xylaria hypoxylon]|uniref:Uncharacterized protein n=1 Tax=Xylaria hypoxylon TaxID=37992 RepID=A0A4Z0YWX4_9PEZI|nr:hypothetical protein E0Z10_g7839 [Xylaria hypoxylon]